MFEGSINNAFKALMDVVPAGVMLVEKDGIISMTNRAASNFLGDISGNLYGGAGFYTLHKFDGTPFSRCELPLYQSLHFGTIIEGQEIIVRQTGKADRFVLESSSPIYDNSNKVIGAIAIFQDITRQKNVEAALRESEENLSVFFNAIKETMMLVDIDRKVLAINMTGAERLGKTPNEIIGKNLPEVIPHAISDKRKFMIEKSIISGKSIRFEDHHDGLHVENVVYPVLDEKGNTIRFATYSRDITEQKAMERKLEQLAAIVESSEEAIISIDLSGTIQSWNNGAERIYGYFEKEAIGQKADIILMPESTEDIKIFIERITKGQIIKQYETLHRRNHGNVIHVSVAVSPIRDKESCLLGISIISHDITARVKAQEDFKRLVRFIESSEVAIIGIMSDATVFAWSRGAEKISGYSSEEVIGNAIFKFLLPENLPAASEIFHKAIAGESVEDYEAELKTKDGTYISVSISSSPMKDADGNIVGVSTIAYDISDRKRIEKAYQESEERFRTAFEGAAVGIALVLPEGWIVKVNRSFCQMLGYTEEELLQKNFREITYHEDLHNDLKYSNQLVRGEIPFYSMEKRYIHKNGTLIWSILSVSLIRDSAGNPLFFVGQIQDITQRKKAEDELKDARRQAEKAKARAEHLAHTDYLTGILNRRAFMEKLKDELEQLRKDASSLCLILADIDHFKMINDTYGHNIGDFVIQKFTQCLLRQCRFHDFIGRHGGEEFILCLPNTTSSQAQKIAERMRIAVEELKLDIPHRNESISITASFGVTQTENHTYSIDVLIDLVDAAMYKAKVSGRNKVCLSSDGK